MAVIWLKNDDWRKMINFIGFLKCLFLFRFEKIRFELINNFSYQVKFEIIKEQLISSKFYIFTIIEKMKINFVIY